MSGLADSTTAAVLFRSSRKRRAHPSDDNSPSPSLSDAPHNDDPDEDQQEESGPVSLAALVRQRNARRARLGGGGVSFRDADATLRESSIVDGADDSSLPTLAIPNRFVVATGALCEPNSRHMRPDPAPASPSQSQKTNPLAKAESEPAVFRGKLFEVDLGEEVRARNEALTAWARRRLAGEPNSGEDVSMSEDRHPPAGKNGTLHGSDAAQRDRLVDEILHENRLDVYDMMPSGSGRIPDMETTEAEDAEFAADDRIAEAFRREFIEALQERQQLRRRRKKPAVQSSGPSSGPNSGPARPGRKADGEILRGPKLGGSRNVRAQMRDILLAQEKEKNKGAPPPPPRRR